MEPAGAGAGSTCYIDESSLRDDDRRSTTRESFRGAPWTAPRPEGRRAAAASRSSSLRPRDALRGTRGRKAVRRATRSPCAARREGRFRRAGRRAPTPNRNGSSSDYDRRTADGPRGAATVAKVAREGRTYAPPRLTRRAATAAPLIRSSPGRRVAVVGRLPGKRRERGRFFGRNQGADTIWDAGRHYEEGDGVRA